MAEAPPRSLRFYLAVGAALAALLFLLLVLTTGVTTIGENEIGVLVRNYREGPDNMEIVEGGRTHVHLPLGLTTIYPLSRAEMSIELVAATGRGDRPGQDNVKIKSMGGADIWVDVTVTFKVDPLRADHLLRRLGGVTAERPEMLASSETDQSSDPMRTTLRAYARTYARDALGMLSIEQMLQANERAGAVLELHRMLQAAVEPWGLQVVTVSVTNPRTAPEYQAMVSERKQFDQQAENEKSRQDKAKQYRESERARVMKEQAVALEKLRRQFEPAQIDAESAAIKLDQEAQTQYEKITREADGELRAAQERAQGLRKQGENEAAGIKALADAYAQGGEALVRKALADKYQKVRLSGRPYSLDSHVDRLRLEEAAPAKNQRAAAAAGR